MLKKFFWVKCLKISVFLFIYRHLTRVLESRSRLRESQRKITWRRDMRGEQAWRRRDKRDGRLKRQNRPKNGWRLSGKVVIFDRDKTKRDIVREKERASVERQNIK